MKVLQISKYYMPHVGGIEKVSYDISCILKENGHDVKIICFSDCSETSKDIIDGIEVTRVGSFCKLFSQNISFSYFFILKRLIIEYKPDVIHIHFPNPLIALYLLIIRPSCPVTIHWHSDIIKNSLLKALFKPIENLSLKMAKDIIATSQLYAENSLRLKNYLEKVVIVPCSIDTRDFILSQEDEKTIQEIKLKHKNKKIVFFMGVHRTYKGIIYLLKASRYLNNDYEIVIAGKGPLTDKLMKASAKMNLSNVTFIGKISDYEKKLYLYSSDVFAFPSITKNEAFGIALAEALYCGLPAVTFNIPGSGVNYVNQNGVTGVEVHGFDSYEYAQALMRVTKEQYGKNAHEWVIKNFTKESIEQKVINFFNEI